MVNDVEMIRFINPDNDPRITEKIISMFRTGHIHKEYYGETGSRRRGSRWMSQQEAI